MAALLGELERLLEDPARDSAAGASRAATAPLVLRGPVDTCVLAPPQVFSWGASPGVLEYAVRLTSSSGRTLASARVRGTSLAIADLRWRPAPGLIYDWSVMPVGAAGPSRAVSAWFRVLPPGEQKALRARCDSLREALQRQGAPPGKVLVGEALVWERSTVRSKAEELLEAAADAAPAGPWNRVARARLAAIRAAGRP